MSRFTAFVKTFKALLDRLYEVQGVPFKELAHAHGITWNPEPAKNKGLAGKIVEATLGKEPDSASQPDLSDLGVEVKSIPIREDLEPRENTKITMFNYGDVATQDWEQSTVYHKLRSTLFVPIVKYEVERPDHWYIRSPFIWMPSTEAEKTLKADYDAARRWVLDKDIDAITSKSPDRGGRCTWLMPNTAGRDSKDTIKFRLDGQTFEAKRRAWMLRKGFTREVLRENIAYGVEP